MLSLEERIVSCMRFNASSLNLSSLNLGNLVRSLNRFILAPLLVMAFFSAQPRAFAQDAKKDQAPKPETHSDNAPGIPPEKSSVTHHDLALDGRTIHYTATAGTLLVRDEAEKPYGSFFYVAYTEDGADLKARPVTFLYNGGPGSASLWLHMGSVGPMRVVTDSPQATGPPPYRLVPNQYSLLDRTDLVFIDAVGTGFSKPVGTAKEKDFTGTDQDVRSFDRFITRYITVNQRWASPKYLMGESYGTTRSAALSDALENDGIACNGVILVSSILNYGIEVPGLDHIFVSYLPSFAAIAYYHNKLANKPADLKAFLNEVRAFARGPYADALAQGDQLSAEQENAIAAKLSAYTGLSVQYLKEANLRVSASRFRKELLRDDREILGRYDARFEATDVDAAGDTPGYDPSSTGITGAFVSAFNDYLSQDLKYDSPDTYLTRGPNVIQDWDWKHRLPQGGGPGRPLWLPYVAGDLADAMRKDPRLKVFSANGLFDLATPFFATEYDLSHMNLDPKLRANVQFGYYPAGHMIYLNVDALKELRSDLENFYAATSHP
jgi:carboxypeptidase C (cathepsin A)